MAENNMKRSLMKSAKAGVFRLTPAHEDYIEALVELEEAQHREDIRSVDIANLLGVSKASVNKAVQTLRETGFIEQERYGRIQMTERGRAYGREVWNRHRFLRRFLQYDLGIDPKIADAEACEMEHAISNATMEVWDAWITKIRDMLGTEIPDEPEVIEVPQKPRKPRKPRTPKAAAAEEPKKGKKAASKKVKEEEVAVPDGDALIG